MNWRSASSITAISLAQIQDRPRRFLIGEESGGKAFLRANSVMLCVSVVKSLEKDSPQRHRGDTENHRDYFSDRLLGVAKPILKRGQARSSLKTRCLGDSYSNSLLLRSRFGDHQWI